VGHAQAAALRAMYGIPAARLRVLWNGVDDALRAAPASPAGGASPPVILSVSTVTAQKGLEHLIDAARMLRDGGDNFRLEIVGDGPLRASLEARSHAHALEGNVLFRGWVPQASAHALPTADIFVQSSLWEAMSVVVLEAMAAGKPMVVTRVGENPHVLDGENNGLLVPPGDPGALAEALRRLLRDAQLRARLGAAARAHYLANFTTRHMIAAYQSLYRELAQPAAATARASGIS
jgi:glycosyltransferase involved in cell wall biosynthesis